MVTGSYFIIQGLELQGVKAICVDTASGAVLPTQNSESEPLPTEGLQCSGRLEWSNVWGLLMSFDIAACVFAYYIFFERKSPTRFLKDIWPVPARILPEYGGRPFSSTSLSFLLAT